MQQQKVLIVIVMSYSGFFYSKNEKAAPCQRKYIITDQIFEVSRPDWGPTLSSIVTHKNASSNDRITQQDEARFRINLM